MRFFKKGKSSHIVVVSNGDSDFSNGRDFAKERRERQVWRPPHPDTLNDFP